MRASLNCLQYANNIKQGEIQSLYNIKPRDYLRKETLSAGYCIISSSSSSTAIIATTLTLVQCISPLLMTRHPFIVYPLLLSRLFVLLLGHHIILNSALLFAVKGKYDNSKGLRPIATLDSPFSLLAITRCIKPE